MNHGTGRISRGARALLIGAALVLAAPLGAKDIYKAYLDPGLPHHRAILDTLERLKDAPQDAGLHNDLGCLIAWDGFWKDALGEFDTAAKLDRKDSRPLFNAGLVYAARGSWSAARRRFASATSREAGNWPAWWMLGFAHEQLGNENAAVKAYTTSLRVDTSLFEVAKNPFAVDSRLRARVLLESYPQRVVRSGMRQREEFANPDRVSAFFQKSPARAAAAAASEAAAAPAPQPVVSTGPVVTQAPAASTARPTRPGAPPAYPPRATRPPQTDPNAEQAQPPDNLPFQNTTPAPKKKRAPVMGPGGGPPVED